MHLENVMLYIQYVTWSSNNYTLIVHCTRILSLEYTSQVIWARPGGPLGRGRATSISLNPHRLHDYIYHMARLCSISPCICATIKVMIVALIAFRPPSAGFPRLLTKPDDTHVFVGEGFLLSCRGNQYATHYHWLKDGDPITSSPPFVSIIPGWGLILRSVTQNDSGVYTCVGSNDDRSASASAVVVVTGPLLTCDGKEWREGREERETEGTESRGGGREGGRVGGWEGRDPEERNIAIYNGFMPSSGIYDIGIGM